LRAVPKSERVKRWFWQVRSRSSWNVVGDCSVNSDGFAARLDLALKALNLSRAGLASSVGVDKSVVSRWLSGQAVPTGHNLARIGEFLASVRPGFSSIAWERPRAEFESLLRIAPPPVDGAGPAPAAGTAKSLLAYPPALMEAASREAALRGAAYEGFWISTRPALTSSDQWARDSILVRKRDGQLHVRASYAGIDGDGWLFLLAGHLHCILHDHFFGRLVYLILNEVAKPPVDYLEGLMMGIGFGTDRAPTAAPIVLERHARLSDDDALNESQFEALKKQLSTPDAAKVTASLRARLVRDFGPTAAAAGGDLLLRAAPAPVPQSSTPDRK
jgi:transcriptional regulator with XRE-family HTH domain